LIKKHLKLSILKYYHLGSSSQENGDSLGVVTFLNDQHAVLGRAEVQLADKTSRAQLIRAQLLETGNDPTTGSDGDQFDLRTPDPPYGRQFPLQEEMVSLIVETPLADCQGCAGFLDLRDHLVELLGLVLAQETVVLNAGDVQLVLGLWLWWFKWASEDSNLYITKLLRKSRLTFRIGKKTTLNKICSYLRRINVSYFTLSDKTKFNTDNKWFSQQDTLAWVWLQLASGSMSKNFCMPCK